VNLSTWNMWSQGSSFSTATMPRAERPGLDSRQQQAPDFLFVLATTLRPAPGPIQPPPPIKRAPGTDVYKIIHVLRQNYHII
jgi:hypothetical protein